MLNNEYVLTSNNTYEVNKHRVGGMLRFRSNLNLNFINGVQHLLIIHGFRRQLTLYSTSIATKVNPNFVDYLVQNLGFSKQQALATSSKFARYRPIRGSTDVTDFDFVEKANSVIKFFHELGLQKSDIRKAVVIEPRILLSNVDKNLAPKTEIFQKLGFSECDVAEVVSFNPSLLLMGLNSTIVPVIEALINIMGCERHVIEVLKKLPYINVSAIRTFLVPNVALLRSYGIPLGSIRKFLLLKPSCFIRRTDFLIKATSIVEGKLGIARTCPRFLLGVNIVSSLNEKTIDLKMQNFRSFGWTDSQITTLVSLNPCVLGYSVDGMKKKLGFLMDEVGFEPSYLALNCMLFTCSLEKRVLPRYKVFLVLKENGFTKLSCFTSMVHYSESKFLTKFVLPFKEVHQVYSKHAGISLEMLTQGSLESNSSAV